MDDQDSRELHAYYARGEERERLAADALGVLEFERTAEILLRYLPPAPCVVADVGGGPGRYALWLAGLGYQVEHRDVVPSHVEQLRAEAGDSPAVRTKLSDARELDLADCSADAVLLLGPVYHLRRRADRIAALAQARRVVRASGPVFVAAISRWAPRLERLRQRLYLRYPSCEEESARTELTGMLAPLREAGFSAYCHRPAQLRGEVRGAGLDVADLVSVEGAGCMLGDLAERMADPLDWAVVLDTARATERVPELLGIGPHLIATAIKPPGTWEPGRA